MPVIWNLEIGPVSTSAFGGGVIFMIDDQRLTQCIAHFLPVGHHGLEFDIFHEVKCARVILEHPLDDFDHSSECATIFAIESCSRVFPWPAFGPTVILPIWE